MLQILLIMHKDLLYPVVYLYIFALLFIDRFNELRSKFRISKHMTNCVPNMKRICLCFSCVVQWEIPFLGSLTYHCNNSPTWSSTGSWHCYGFPLCKSAVMKEEASYRWRSNWIGTNQMFSELLVENPFLFNRVA